MSRFAVGCRGPVRAAILVGLAAVFTAADVQAQATEPADPALQPGGFAARFGALKQKYVRDDGGSGASEGGVLTGLIWLIRHQAADGHWSFHEFPLHGKCNCTATGIINDAAATGLALLPLLGAGHTHQNADRDHPYAGNVDRGLKWLLARQARDGALGGGYAHPICTLALCEAYAMTRDPALKEPAQKAIDASVAWQNQGGGFRYFPRMPGDLSVTAWYVQAFKSAQLGGLKVPGAALNGINAHLDALGNRDGSAYGYQNAHATPPMSAAGLLCRQFQGWDARKPGLVKGVDSLMKTPPSPNLRNVYYYYYANQVIRHAGGAPWQNWNPRLRDLTVAGQDQGVNPRFRDQAGSWSPEGDAWGKQMGRLGMTCMSMLNLEVYYRHLPLYARDEQAAPAVKENAQRDNRRR